MKITLLAAILVVLTALVCPVLAQQSDIQPTKDQSDQQMEQDKEYCYNLAKQNTGYDPAADWLVLTGPPQRPGHPGYLEGKPRR